MTQLSTWISDVSNKYQNTDWKSSFFNNRTVRKRDLSGNSRIFCWFDLSNSRDFWTDQSQQSLFSPISGFRIAVVIPLTILTSIRELSYVRVLVIRFARAMLYGGPLGTYLSGLSSTSSTPLTSSTGSSYGTQNVYGSSNYLNSGLRRTNSRYRSNGSGTNLTPNSTSTGVGNSLSSYYTPQLRRKYGTPEVSKNKTCVISFSIPMITNKMLTSD